MSLFNEDDDFSVDRFQLEIEAERNSKLMRKYGKLLAVQSAIVKDEKRRLNYVETETAEIIRSNASAYGLKGTSDKVVYGLVQNEPEYIKQFNRWLNATRREEDYKNAVDTCRQRGMMIRVLTEQWLNNYYSKPVVYDPATTKRKKLKRIQTDEDDKQLNDF
jgi:hypothetical protein